MKESAPDWFSDSWARLPSKELGQYLCDLLADVHERMKASGGLFNAYEKAVQFELQSALYAKGIWGTRAEVSIPSRGGKCDLVLPLDTKDFLWLELKLIWFAGGRPHTYRSTEKYRQSPSKDWTRLRKVKTVGGRRGVLVLCGWDSFKGCDEQATHWLAAFKSKMSKRGAKLDGQRDLDSFPFPFGNQGEVQNYFGKVACWVDK